MARLIEFFSRGGELVLDPFAGVGGTLLGAAIAPTDPHAGWQRGRLVRGSQYVFVLTKLGPMYDPTDPSTWRPNL